MYFISVKIATSLLGLLLCKYFLWGILPQGWCGTSLLIPVLLSFLLKQVATGSKPYQWSPSVLLSVQYLLLWSSSGISWDNRSEFRNVNKYLNSDLSDPAVGNATANTSCRVGLLLKASVDNSGRLYCMMLWEGAELWNMCAWSNRIALGRKNRSSWMRCFRVWF